MSHCTGMAIGLDSIHALTYVDGVPSHGPSGVFGQFRLVGGAGARGARGGVAQELPPQSMPLPQTPSTTTDSSSSARTKQQTSSSSTRAGAGRTRMHSPAPSPAAAAPAQRLLTWDEYRAFRQFKLADGTPPSSLVAVVHDHSSSPCPPRTRTASKSKSMDMSMEIEVELASGMDLCADDDDDDASSESSDGSDDSGDEDGVATRGATQQLHRHPQPKRGRPRASSTPASLRAAIDIPMFALVPSTAYREFEDLQTGGGSTGAAAAVRVVAPTCHSTNQNSSTARTAASTCATATAKSTSTSTSTTMPVAPATLSAWDNNRAALGSPRTPPVPIVSGRKRHNAALTTSTSTTRGSPPRKTSTSARSVSLAASYQQKRRRSHRYGGGLNQRGDEDENVQQALWN